MQDKATLGMEKQLKTAPLREMEVPSRLRAPACLVYICPVGTRAGRRFPLRDGPVVLGRDRSCQVLIDDPAVSRRHAQVRREADGYVLHDLQSTNGTQVNDQSVLCHRLREGDYIRIGNAVLRFLTGESLEAAYQEEIHRQAVMDGLTGVYNRRYLLEFLSHELEQVQRFQRSLALLLLDIDHFKRINDEKGHLTGDQVLRELAGLLGAQLPGTAVLARFGGEEFVIVLPGSTAEAAVALAERLRVQAEHSPFQVGTDEVRLTLSLGAVVFPAGDRLTAEQALALADGQMYQAKRAGRNCVRALQGMMSPPPP